MRLKVGLTAVVTMVALLGASPIPAEAQVLSEQPFSGYATGTQLSTSLLQVGDVTVANVQQAFAGASVDSQGIGEPILNEMQRVVQPALPDKNAHGRGAGLEIGAAVGAEGLNQLVLAGLAQASAPPPEGPVTTSIDVDVPPVIFAGLLEGQAQAIYANDVCTIGQPISYGSGEATNVQLLPTGPDGPGGAVNTATGAGETVAQSRSFEYLAANGDGTFGLVSETRQILAPITIGAPTLGVNPITIRVDGEFVMRVTASGKPGRPAIGALGSGSSIEFSDPLISVKAAVVPGVEVDVVPPVQLSTLLGGGINLPLPPLVDLSVGGAPRAIGSDAAPAPPPIAADGTSVSAAYDLIQLGLLTGLPGLNGVDLRVGHMEAAAVVPPGGIRCNIPLIKTAQPDPASAGQDVTVTITIPDVERFNIFYQCDLLNISATDTTRAIEGNPRFHFTSASHGGIIEGNVIRWPNLGNYTRGSPPIVLTVIMRIDGGTGLLEDIVDVAATLGNCTGGIAGQDIVGTIIGDNGAITGRLVHRGPEVGRGTLPPTGGDMTPLVLGGFLLLAALGVRTVVRRSSVRQP